MKLIDLLVQELPKRGGWPVAVNLDFIQWCNKHHLKFEVNHDNSFFSDLEGDYVSFLDYQKTKQAALAAAQQPAWSGECLPPVGCEFEYGKHRTKAKCLGIGHQMIFASKGDPDDEEGDFEEFMLSIVHSEFHPIRSEADKKRDAIIEALKYYVNAVDASDLYDAIVAGEVKGVKLDV